ncbi:hypothetical protein C4D60_Mb07t11110 [Musa balbisiana]|uniref:Hflx-type G domain-containing protein n=1 Tax=Musa balbisiana TaxID=52838 RepID=A0A4S8JGE7_MUSBA|nr:hypothetical protein C4D60_Mb07t11110 [Musa balbisiana]
MSVCFFSTTPHRVTSTAAASSFSRPLHCQTYPSFHHCGFGHHFRYHVPPIKFLSTPWMSRARLIGVLKESSEVETDDRQRAPASDQEELEEAADGVVANGVVAETSKEGSDLVRKVPVRSKRKIDEEEDEYDRYTLRNGREVFQEKAYLVGVECKSTEDNTFSIEESLQELAQLADTAGLSVVASTYQKLANPNPRTYIGSGKVAEIKSAIHALDVETVIFDDELSAGQLRNLEKALGGDVRVALAQMEYQLPRLTKMWTHLERQTGGKVKGMGEKQIEVDKRILRTQISALRKELESVRQHRKQYRNRRLSVPVPVVSLVGYTNAGKSTLLNRLTGADVLAEDQLFATLDPTTRRVQVSLLLLILYNICSFVSDVILMKNGSEFLLTDTVGFIQKLPTMLIDKADDPERLQSEAEQIGAICISAISGDGLEQFSSAVQAKLKDSLVPVEALIPYDKGDLLNSIHQVGMVERTEFMENGTLIRAHVPLPLARLLTPMRQLVAAAQ